MTTAENFEGIRQRSHEAGAEVVRQVLQTLELVDSPPEEEFDVYTRLVTRMLKAPVALVSVVEEQNDRQYFKAQTGLQGRWAEERQTPLSHSFCQYVKRDNRPLIIEHAPDDARVCGNLAISELNVKAYLGVPFHCPEGAPLGALCAIDSQRREWSRDHVRLLVDLAAILSNQIGCRAALKRAHGLM